MAISGLAAAIEPDEPRPVELRALSPAELPCTAETAECTCPEFCERDHERD